MSITRRGTLNRHTLRMAIREFTNDDIKHMVLQTRYRDNSKPRLYLCITSHKKRYTVLWIETVMWYKQGDSLKTRYDSWSKWVKRTYNIDLIVEST